MSKNTAATKDDATQAIVMVDEKDDVVDTAVPFENTNNPQFDITSKLQDQDSRVNHPSHYTSHPSGVECIEVAEHFNFNLGNAFKYLWRADLKDDAIEDLKKARFYIDRELERRAKFTK